MTVNEYNPVVPIQQCTSCKAEYPATTEYWHKQKHGKYGVNSRCKPCRKAYNHDWVQANLPHVIARAAAWRAANPEQKKKNSHDYYQDNLDKIRAYREANRERQKVSNRVWRQTNTERAKITNREWHRANPKKSTEYTQRRRALISASPEHFTASDLQLQYRSQKGLCWHCSTPLNNVYHVDHLIPLAQGGSNAPDNICCSCAPCNLSKGAKTVAQWKGM